MIFCASTLRSDSGRSKPKSKVGEVILSGREPFDFDGVCGGSAVRAGFEGEPVIREKIVPKR